MPSAFCFLPTAVMKVKICGVTSVAGALICAEAGADLIGLNFYPRSPRFLSRDRAREIASTLRARPDTPILVGVFVNETAGAMKAMLDEYGLDLAQLSGDESDDVLAAMGERGFKAIRIRQPPIPPRSLRQPQGATGTIATSDQLVLLDAHAAGQYGGTGKTADWQAAAELAKHCRLLLAGGLTPENVAAAVERVRPWGVDVASGVESAPGVKDRAKVIQFIREAKQAIGV